MILYELGMKRGSMKKNTLIILLIFLGIATGMVLFIKLKTIHKAKRSVGIHIFSKIPYGKISQIEIKDHNNSVSLIKEGGVWRVKEYYNYLADFSQISDLIEKLRNVSTGNEFKADRSTLKRLMLIDPDDPNAKDGEKGKAIIFKDSSGRLIKKIIFGKAMTKKGGFPIGQYVRFGEDNTVYLINEYLTSLTKGPKEWIRLQIVNIRPLDIKKITGFKDGKVEYILERKKEGERFQVKKGEEKIKDKISKIKDGLNYLTIEGVVDPRKAKDPSLFGISDSSYVQYELFDGMIYRIYPSSFCKKEKCYIKVSVSYKGKKKELLEKANKQNRLLSSWIFEVSKWRHGLFFLP